jgi:hypothetical protein
MSILNDILNTSQMGEPARLDYAISENEKLKAQVDALVALLVAKGIVTEDEASRLQAAAKVSD